MLAFPRLTLNVLKAPLTSGLTIRPVAAVPVSNVMPESATTM